MNKKALVAILQSGHTQQEIAVKMGCQQHQVSAWLNGKRVPSSRNLLILSDAIGKSPHDVANLLEMVKNY